MRRLASALAKLCIVALVTLLVLEGALQLAFPRLPQAIVEKMPQYLERSGHRLDTEHGAREYPALEIVDYEVGQTSGDLYRLTCLSPDDAPPFEPYRVRFQRDAHGFRNEEPWPDQIDLAIIGDSFVAAEAINEPFWRDLSESQLVLGLPGSGTLEQRRLFVAFAAPRMPKTVILSYFGGNDLSDSAGFAEMLRQGETFARRVHKGKHLLDYSVLLSLALVGRDRIAARAGSCHYPGMAMTEPRTAVAFYDELLLLMAKSETDIRDSESFRLTAASIAEMAASLSERAGRFVLMYIPQKAELYWRLLSDKSKAEIVSRLEAEFENANALAIDAKWSVQRDLLSEMADGLGIEFLDLSAPLSAAIAAGQQPYFFADTHWNQLGHNIARNALLEHLNQSNLEK